MEYSFVDRYRFAIEYKLFCYKLSNRQQFTGRQGKMAQYYSSKYALANLVLLVSENFLKFLFEIYKLKFIRFSIQL